MVPSIAIMTWLTLFIGFFQCLFLIQQLFLVGHETTSFYVSF